MVPIILLIEPAQMFPVPLLTPGGDREIWQVKRSVRGVKSDLIAERMSRSASMLAMITSGFERTMKSVKVRCIFPSSYQDPMV